MNNFKVGIHDFNDKVQIVTMFQLLQWKYALAFEAAHMEFRAPVSTRVRKFLSAPRDYTRSQLASYIAICVSNINEQMNNAA